LDEARAADDRLTSPDQSNPLAIVAAGAKSASCLGFAVDRALSRSRLHRLRHDRAGTRRSRPWSPRRDQRLW